MIFFFSRPGWSYDHLDPNMELPVLVHWQPKPTNPISPQRRCPQFNFTWTKVEQSRD